MTHFQKAHLANHGKPSVWIGFSSSVILFNKWVLDTLNFRTLHRTPEREIQD